MEMDVVAAPPAPDNCFDATTQGSQSLALGLTLALLRSSLENRPQTPPFSRCEKGERVISNRC